MNSTTQYRSRRAAWVAFAAGFVCCLGGLFFDLPRVFQAYWIAWIFWSGVSFGALLVLMLHTLAGGAWGDAVRPTAEAAAMTGPMMAVLFLPTLFGLGHLFPWVQASTFTGQDWPHKHAYLTVPWFLVRSLFYLLVLCALSAVLGLWKRPSGLRARLPGAPANATAVNSAGMIGYFAVMLFASTDWVLSLEPPWSSTMFVVIFAVDQFLAALAFCVFVAIRSRKDAPLTTKALHDLGNLLLAFVIFWAYVTYSQFLLIWSGNLPREISWYLHRSGGGWPSVTVGLVAIQFGVPFVLLLSRAAKRHATVLAPIAVLIFVANAVHVWWLIAPSFQTSGVRFPLLELAAFLGIGGAWCALFLGYLHERTLAGANTQLEKLHA